MSYIDRIISAHYGKRDDFDVMYNYLEERHMVGALVKDAGLLESLLVNDYPNQANRVYASLEAGMHGLMYALVINNRESDGFKDSRHDKYVSAYSKVVEYCKTAQIRGSGSRSMNSPDTTVGHGGMSHTPSGLPRVSLDAPSTLGGLPEPDPIPTHVETTPTVSEPVEQPTTVEEVTPKNNRGVGFMESYEMHELSAVIATNSGSRTVRDVSTETKQWLRQQSVNLGNAVSKFIKSDRKNATLDKSGLLKLNRDTIACKVTFDKSVYGPAQSLTELPDFFNQLHAIVREILDYNIDENNVEDMYVFLSATAQQLLDFKKALIGESYEGKHQLSVLAGAIDVIYSEVIRNAWTGATNNSIPPCPEMPDGATVSLGVDALKSLSGMYKDMVSRYYIDDQGVMYEESELYEIACRLIRALQTVVLNADLTHHEGDGPDDAEVDLIVSLESHHLNIVLDCINKTIVKAGPLDKLCGGMSQYIDEIYREATAIIPELKVFVVMGGVYAEVIGSLDSSARLNFIRQ